MYGNIKESDLDTPCLMNDEEGRLMTIRERLDELCLDEELEYVDYKLTQGRFSEEITIGKFTAWTESYVIIYMSALFGEEYFMKLDRNPPPKNMRY